MNPLKDFMKSLLSVLSDGSTLGFHFSEAGSPVFFKQLEKR